MSSGLGDRAGKGAGHFAHEGLIKRSITSALIDLPGMIPIAAENKIEAYTLPQGVLSQLTREMAAGRPGLITHVGLHTFVDPRHGGGRQSALATEDLVELVIFAGKEWLFYKPFSVDIAFLRGTTADEDGNVTMEQEAIFGEMISMAQATRRAGGVVVVQVKRIAKRGTLPPKQVKIPGMLVDLIVVDPDQTQTFVTQYSPAYAGELRVPLSEIDVLPFGPRKVVARRAALELFPEAICNLGSGISTGIASLAAEEGALHQVVLTNEQGLIGGAPATGNEAGASRNFQAMIDQPYQFDFYDGGGLDLAFLSFAEVDRACNVNVSRFGDRIIGIGRLHQHQPERQDDDLQRHLHQRRTQDRSRKRPVADRAGGATPQVRRIDRADLLQRALCAGAGPHRHLRHRARRVARRRWNARSDRDRARRRAGTGRARPHGVPAAGLAGARADGPTAVLSRADEACRRSRRQAARRGRIARSGLTARADRTCARYNRLRDVDDSLREPG